MFEFIERPVAVRDYEFTMSPKRPVPFVMQGGIQPAETFQEDIGALERPHSYLSSVFTFRKRKG